MPPVTGERRRKLMNRARIVSSPAPGAQSLSLVGLPAGVSGGSSLDRPLISDAGTSHASGQRSPVTTVGEE